MDTVCIGGFREQEEPREIILRTFMVTAFFPAVHAKHGRFARAR